MVGPGFRCSSNAPAVNESLPLTVVDCKRSEGADPESSQFCVTCIHGLALQTTADAGRELEGMIDGEKRVRHCLDAW